MRQSTSSKSETLYAALLVVLAVSLCVIMPLLFISFTDITWTTQAIGVGCVMEYSGLRLVFLMLDRRARLMEVGFHVFSYIWLGLAPLLQVLSGHYPWSVSHTPEEWLISEGVVIVGVLTYDLGVALGTGSKGRSRANSKALALQKLPFRRAVAVSLVSVPMTIGILAVTGLGRLLFTSRAEIGAAAGDLVSSIATLNLLGAFITVPLAPCSLIVVVMMADRRLTGTRRLIVKTCLLVTVSLSLIVLNPIANARVSSGSYICALLLALSRSTKRINLYMGSFFIAGMILVLPLADAFRYEAHPGSFTFTPASTMVDKGDFDAFQQVANTVATVDAYGHTWGHQLIGACLFWFPRSIWHDKPLSSGQLVGESIESKFTNFSCPLWAELYLDFGVLGVGVGFVVFGYVSSRLQDRSVSDTTGAFRYEKVLLCFLAGYQAYLLRGDLMNALAYSSNTILFILLTAYGKPIVRSGRRLAVSAGRIGALALSR